MDVSSIFQDTLGELKDEWSELEERYRFKRCYIVKNSDVDRDDNAGVVVTVKREAERLARCWGCMYDESWIYIPRKKGK